MKLIVNEAQLDKIMGGGASIKKLLFKYWDKFGGNINDNMLKMFGFKNNRLGDVFLVDIRRFLIEWRGEEKSLEYAKEIISNNPHKIGNEFICGGYDFEFSMKINSIPDNNMIYVDVFVNSSSPNATVDMIMVGGETYQLSDAMKNEDYGWEVENEVDECIYDYIESKVINETGIDVVVNKTKHI